MLLFLIEMGEKDIHEIIEPRAPIGVDAVFAKTDGETFKCEHHGGVVIAQLMNKTPVLDALTVIKNPIIRIFAFEVLLYGLLEAGQDFRHVLRTLDDEFLQFVRLNSQRLMIRC